MGARRVVRWVPQAPGADAKAFEFLCKAAESLRGGRRQQHRVECLTADVKPAGPKSGAAGRQALLQIRCGDDTGALLVLPAACKVVSSDCVMLGKGGFLERAGLGGGGGARRGVQFEGVRYALGDLALFVAQASAVAGSREFLGVVAEVECRPLASLAAAGPLLEDFLDVLRAALAGLEGCPAGELQPVAADHASFQLADAFTELHAAVNYQALCRACTQQQ